MKIPQSINAVENVEDTLILFNLFLTEGYKKTSNSQGHHSPVFKLQHPPENTAGTFEAAHGNSDLYYSKMTLKFCFRPSLNDEIVGKLRIFFPHI